MMWTNTPAEEAPVPVDYYVFIIQDFDNGDDDEYDKDDDGDGDDGDDGN